MPATYFRIARSKDQALKYETRLQLVQYAAEYGIKPAARHFGCQVRIVRKWLRRWREANHARSALQDRSRAPKNCPHKTPKALENQVLRERLRAPCLGARRLKRFCKLAPSEGAIARILRQGGLTSRRKRKHEKKRDMRAVKARLALFEQLQVDSKYLDDIPYYLRQLAQKLNLPLFQYTARCPKSGGIFLGFANELSEANACAFIAAVLHHIERCGFPRKGTIVQTDNGSEYSGAERKVRHDRGFTHVVRDLFGAHHRFIPPGKKNHQADVESLHATIEYELLDLERFASRKEFFLKATVWQLWYNVVRENAHKGDLCPDDILLAEQPARSPSVWLLPALDIDALMAKRAQDPIDNKDYQRGYYLPALPEKGDSSPSGRFHPPLIFHAD